MVTRKKAQDVAPISAFGNFAPVQESETDNRPSGGTIKLIPRKKLVGSDKKWGMFQAQPEEAVADLADSIYKNGLISPITVRELDDGKYEILAGHTRNRAYQYIIDHYEDVNIDDFASIRALVYPKNILNDQQAKEIYVDSNLFQRGELPIKEQAACIEYKIAEMKKSSKYGSGDVAAKLGEMLDMSRSDVYRWRKIAAMDPTLLELLESQGIRKPNVYKLALLSIEDQKQFAILHKDLIRQYALDELPIDKNITLNSVTDALDNIIKKTKESRKAKHFNRSYVLDGRSDKRKPAMVLLKPDQIERFKTLMSEEFNISDVIM